MGLRVILFSEAFELTAPGVRPSFRPITLVGVFPFASFFSSEISAGVHSLPEFRVDFGIMLVP